MPRKKSWSILAVFVLASFSLTVATYFLVAEGVYRASEIGTRVSNGLLIIVILAWGSFAWLVRVLVIGRRPKLTTNSLAILVFGILRLVLLVASVLAGICWLIALALGLEFAQDLLESFVILVVLSALIGIVGGGIIDVLLTLKLIPIGGTVSTTQTGSDLKS